MIAEAPAEPVTEYVMSFPPAPTDAPTVDCADNYRIWLAPRRFNLVRRTRQLGSRTIVSWDVIDPEDGMRMGVVREKLCNVECRLSVPSIDTTTGKAGRTLRDTFTCQGGLSGEGPWVFTRTAPCRKGCPVCLAPGELFVERAPR
jgi:hypothetical protein